MANIVIIEPVNPSILQVLSDIKDYGTALIKLPLLDDIVINAESEIAGFGELVPNVAEIIGFLTSGEQIISGSNVISKTAINLQNKLDVPRWKGTKPLEIQVKLGFYTDIYDDDNISGGITKFGHWIHKLNRIIAMSILTFDKSGAITVPGGSISDMKKTQEAIQSNDKAAAELPKSPSLTSTSKLVTVTIPGIIYLNLAAVKQVSITYSKHITENGYPLWATADVSFMSLMPASFNMFDEGVTKGKELTRLI